MTIKNNEQCSVCGRFANRGVTIDAVIIRNQMILLIKRRADPYKGFWALPGGYVDWDESVEDAVKREVKEEADLDLKGLKLVGVYSKPERHPKQAINAAYIVDAAGEAKAGDDALKADWFKLSDLPEELAFDHAQIIADAIKLIGDK